MSYKTKGSMEDDLKQKENMSTMEMREHLKISRAEFSRRYNIPVRTLENWESGKSKCPDYVRQLLERAVLEDCEK
jgi:putative transcriptional regulator